MKTFRDWYRDKPDTHFFKEWKLATMGEDMMDVWDRFAADMIAYTEYCMTEMEAKLNARD